MSPKPRCFSGVKSLLCGYHSQKKSWMDGDLFTEWVKELEETLQLKTGRSL